MFHPQALPGLAHALRTMATKMPEDPTEWLCARLKALRPVVAREYTESVLKAHVMKCDEVCQSFTSGPHAALSSARACVIAQFEDIHLLATERPHPQAWNFRRTEAKLPVFGSGQCHLGGIVFLAEHLKRDLGFQRVLWCGTGWKPEPVQAASRCQPGQLGGRGWPRLGARS